MRSFEARCSIRGAAGMRGNGYSENWMVLELTSRPQRRGDETAGGTATRTQQSHNNAAMASFRALGLTFVRVGRIVPPVIEPRSGGAALALTTLELSLRL